MVINKVNNIDNFMTDGFGLYPTVEIKDLKFIVTFKKLKGIVIYFSNEEFYCLSYLYIID